MQITRMSGFNMKSKAAQLGASMIEVLVSLIVLSTGILGMAGLQSESINNSKSSYYKTQATMLISDLSSRMRANGAGAAAKHYVYSGETKRYSTTGTVCDEGCNASELAKSDLDEWIEKVKQSLPKSEVAISKDASGEVYQLTLYWKDAGSTGVDLCEADTTTDKLCMTAFVKVCANGTDGGIAQCGA
jgi:type IV pilus assembly protein PilV